MRKTRKPAVTVDPPPSFALEISRAALVLTGPGCAAFVELKHLAIGPGEQTIRVREGVDIVVGGRGSTLRIEGRG